jgi:hypothetical protein
MRRKRRRGGELRSKICKSKSGQLYVISDPRLIPSALTLWGEGVLQTNRQLIECNFGLWGISQLGVEYRGFLFNLMQGRLYLNNALARIINTPPQCTFCLVKAKRELRARGLNEANAEYNYYLNLQPIENTDHLFWSCESAQDIVQKCYRWIRGLDWYRGIEVIDRKSYFEGIHHEWKTVVIVDLIWKHFVKFSIYQCRSKKQLPTFPNLKFEMEGLFIRPGMTKLKNKLYSLNVLYD